MAGSALALHSWERWRPGTVMRRDSPRVPTKSPGPGASAEGGARALCDSLPGGVGDNRFPAEDT